MIIAIPATKNKLNALVDERFGRCPFFCLHNTETGLTEFIGNRFRNETGGSGPCVSESLAERGVNKIFAAEFGPKAKDLLDKLGVECHLIKEGLIIREILEIINPGLFRGESKMPDPVLAQPRKMIK